ncbi:MAG: hypothetical protein ACK48Y_21455 [Planctomyces sp.]
MSSVTAAGLRQRTWVQEPMLWFLLAQAPALLVYGYQSWPSAQFRAFPLFIPGLLWIAISECGGRRERWRPECFLLIMANLAAFCLGAVKGSAWLLSFGVACGAFAWILARRRHVAGRVVFSLALLLLLLVRLPPSLSKPLESRFDATVSRLAGSVLIASEVLHYSDNGGLHLEQKVLNESGLRGGLAGCYSLIVLSLIMGTLMHRSALHLLLLLAASAWCGVMMSVGGTVLGVYFYLWTGIDVSSGIAGIIWRFDVMLLGLAFVWSADQAILVLTHAIPVMDEVVSGRRVIRRMDDEDDEMLERPMFRSNGITRFFNTWIAPARPGRPLLAGVPAGAVLSPIRGSANDSRPEQPPRPTEESEGSGIEELRLRGAGPWLLALTAAAIMLIVQALRFIRI